MATAAFEFVLGNLLYHFDWKLPDGMETQDLSMEEELGLAVHKKIPLCLVPIKDSSTHGWNFQQRSAKAKTSTNTSPQKQRTGAKAPQPTAKNRKQQKTTTENTKTTS
ncbi:hypothetical protein QYF36_017264 [Acer negundo]|nr:hypothetical protein QYF36_017264 [Acer negundo]